jgi:uncharacterized membrane protein YtjA (UPF0391 family)
MDQAYNLSCYLAFPLFEQGGLIMLYWAGIFLVIGIIAGILGLVGVAGTATYIAYVLFVVFIVIAIISFIIGRRPPAGV